MAAGDSPSTLAELQTAFLEALKEVTGNSTINTIVTRFLNQALQDIHVEKWWWAERRSTLRTNPPYTTGTVDVAVTNLTTRRTVTGSSTLWNTANSFGDINGIAAGARMDLADNIAHLVSTINSDTSITLDTTTPYTGSAALAAAGYAIYQDEYGLASDFATPYNLLFFDLDRTIRFMGTHEFDRLYPRNLSRESPRHAALIELGPSGSAALRPRIKLGPAPDATYILPYRYYTSNLAVSSAGVAARFLSAAGDEPIVPHPFRMMIVYKALALWYGTRQKNAALQAQADAEYTTVTLRARQRGGNEQDRPRFQPQIASYWRHARTPYRAGARRWDGGSAFDRLDY